MSSVPLSPILEATAWWSNMFYIARSPANNKLLVIQSPDGSLDEQGIRLVNEGFTLYSVNPQGDGTFLLVPQQVTNIVTEQRVVGGELIDA